jgi:hypothetical protein
MNLRRRLLAFLVVAPAAAWAQPAAGIHRIGTLSGGFSPKAKEQEIWPVFFEGMRKLGYEEGRNVVYEFRYAEGSPARFPQLASELVATGVQLIVVTGSTEAVAASRATATVPIVAIHATDPVELGLAVNLARPGRNLTGSTLTMPGFAAKSLELLTEAFPNAKRISVLGNPTQPNYADFRQELERVAADKAITLLPTSEAKRPEELEAALDRIAKEKPQAMLVLVHALFPAPAPACHCLRGADQDSRDVRFCPGCRGWRIDGLCSRHPRLVRTRVRVCRQDIEGGEAGRHPNRTADPFWTVDQRENRAGDGHYDSARCPRARRRPGNRVNSRPCRGRR